MAPIEKRPTTESSVPTTLAWVIGGAPTYALEGNILSSGATLAWAANLLTDGSVADLISLAEAVPDSGGVTLVPAFAGLGAPHWDRDAHALLSGMSEATRRAHIARAAVDSIGHQICDVVDVIEQQTAALRLFRADGGATASDLVVQTQADLLGRDVQVGEVAEVSALGAARLAWASLGGDTAWPVGERRHGLRAGAARPERRRRRRRWAGEVAPDPATEGGRAMTGTVAPQWREVELAFTGPAAANPYIDVDAWITFRHTGGEEVRRPVFWDGGTRYVVRFASPEPAGEWQWEVHAAQRTFWPPVAG